MRSGSWGCLHAELAEIIFNMKKKPLTPRDIAVLAVVVAVFVGVIALFVVLASDGNNPAYHKCGDDPCPFTIGGP